LLRNSQRHVDEIVKEVGFDSRSTLFRALRRFHGLTPRECRHTAESPAFMGAAPTIWTGTSAEEALPRTTALAH
jgi:AraC-like DNA-binding protein